MNNINILIVFINVILDKGTIIKLNLPVFINWIYSMLKRDPRVPYFMQALGQDVCEALDKFGMFRSDIF